MLHSDSEEAGINIALSALMTLFVISAGVVSFETVGWFNVILTDGQSRASHATYPDRSERPDCGMPVGGQGKF